LNAQCRPNWFVLYKTTKLVVYVKKEAEHKNFAGTKQMKAKEQDTLMVCTAADGTKCPVAMIRKSKRPVCFKKELPCGELSPV
jgi:hypothetical protein